MTDATIAADHATDETTDFGLHTIVPPGEAGWSLARVHDTLLAHLPAGDIAIYEAGGGAVSFLPPPLLRRARVTVVDLDPTQVAKNRYAERTICGDIQTYRPPPESVDLVVCYNVIEHLPDVPSALDRFAEAVRPGGLILIGAPHPYSLSGLVTKYSPLWFHVWYYRTVLGSTVAGLPGEVPFPVHYHPLVLPRRLKDYMDARGFDTLYEHAYESPRYPEMRARNRALGLFADGVTGLMNLMLARRANVRDGDYHVILRKRVA